VSAADVVLGRRQLYMLPSRHGWWFAGMLAVLGMAAINYSNSLVYALTFLLASVGVIAMLHTHRNLHRLRVTVAAPVPVFAGETAVFPLCLINDSTRQRLGIVVEQTKRERARADLPPGETRVIGVTVPATRRGWLAMPPFRVSTRFPLGILYSWSRTLTLPARLLVYPAPAANGSPETGAGDEAGAVPVRFVRGGDDFAGLREYQPADSPRHIHWKALARGQGWLTKEFGHDGSAVRWFDFDALAPRDVETRLSMLCRDVLDADRESVPYGLRLPGNVIQPSTGEAHRERCLEALALYGGP
jgi:uncharacterized protein (DUF58 family)